MNKSIWYTFIIILALASAAHANEPASSEGDQSYKMDFDQYASQYDGKTWDETTTPKTPDKPAADPADKAPGKEEETPEPEVQPEPEPEAGGEPPKEAEAKIKLADGTEATQEELTAWREAHGKSQSQAQQAELTTLRQQADLHKQQLQYILNNPQQFEQIRQQLGMAPTQQPSDGRIDPIARVGEWKYARTQEYLQAGWTDAKAIQQNVDKEHREQTVEAMLVQNQQREQQFQQLQNEQRLAREAQEITNKLEPLYKRYPRAATELGRKLVNSLLIAEVHGGNANPDFEAAVKQVHEIQPTVIKEYVAQKKALAKGASVIDKGSSRGGVRKTAVDSLPDTVDSLGRFAEMKIAGKV